MKRQYKKQGAKKNWDDLVNVRATCATARREGGIRAGHAKLRHGQDKTRRETKYHPSNRERAMILSDSPLSPVSNDAVLYYGATFREATLALSSLAGEERRGGERRGGERRGELAYFINSIVIVPILPILPIGIRR